MDKYRIQNQPKLNQFWLSFTQMLDIDQTSLTLLHQPKYTILDRKTEEYYGSDFLQLIVCVALQWQL